MQTVSVIIPCYNVEAHLATTVDSVLRQTFSNLELILVNDGSTDDTEQICHRIAAQDKRVKVLSQKNQGVVAARQQGFLGSSGNIIFFVDADDTLETDALQKVIEIFSSHAVDLVRFGYKKLNSKFEFIAVQNPEIEGKYEVQHLLNHGPDHFKRLCSASIWDKAYSASLVRLLFEMIGSVRINHSEDMLFSLAAVINAERTFFLQESLYNYVQRHGSVIHSFNPYAVRAKEKYFRTLTALFARQERFKDFEHILCLESNESVNYILINTMKYSPNFQRTLAVLRDLKNSSFFAYCINRRGGLPAKQRIRDSVLRVPALAALFLLLAKFYLNRVKRKSLTA